MPDEDIKSSKQYRTITRLRIETENSGTPRLFSCEKILPESWNLGGKDLLMKSQFLTSEICVVAKEVIRTNKYI